MTVVGMAAAGALLTVPAHIHVALPSGNHLFQEYVPQWLSIDDAIRRKHSPPILPGDKAINDLLKAGLHLLKSS